MPLRDTEWILVTEWVRDHLLDTPDPHNRLTGCGFSEKFVGSLELIAVAQVNAENLVRASRATIDSQVFLLDVLVTRPEMIPLPAIGQAREFLSRLEEDRRVHASDQDPFFAVLLRSGAEAFVDREDLRKRLQEFLADPDKTVLAVDGEPDSGRSYTYNLIRYLGQHRGFRPVRITLTQTSTAAQLIRRLAGFVRDRRDPVPPLNAAQLNDPQSWIAEAVHEVVARATMVPERLWFVIDDCDRLDAHSDVWDCIGQLAQAIFDFGPGSDEAVPRLVLLGYGPTMPQLSPDVSKNMCLDTARTAGPDDVEAFFRQFFTNPPVSADEDELTALVELCATAVMGAARAPGQGSYMRRLCEAAETAVRTHRFLRPGEDFAARLHQQLLTGAGPQAEPVPDTRRAYREAACLLTGFDPAKLRLPGETESSGGAGLALVQDCMVLTPPPAPRWALKEEVRQAALRGLAGPEAARRALEANLDLVPEGPGPELVAHAWLTGNPPERQSPDAGDARYARYADPAEDAEALADTLQAVLWLSEVPGTTGLPDPEQVRRRLERARLLQPLRHLVRNPFCGRDGELEALRAYALDDTGGPVEQPPLLIHGLAGIGKSTLLATFLLDIRDDVPGGFPFAYIDFERPTLSVHEPATLIAEAARQLGIQYPDQRAAFDALAGECEETARTQRQEQKTVDELNKLPTTRSGAGRASAERFNTLARERETTLIRKIAELVRQAVGAPAGTPGPPLVIAVDSFEAAQYRANPVLGRLWAVWVALQEAYPRLRWIVAGRAPVNHPAQAAEPRIIDLGELEPDAAVELLTSCGITNQTVARALAERVGGHPLSLKLAAHAAVSEQWAGSLDELMDSLPASRRGFYRNIDRTIVQGALYGRILNRIPKPDVRALAQAGLALRTITPELIREVLAEPCGLTVDSGQEARRLFGGLARLDLMEPAGPGTLRHRSDLRSIMLRQTDTARTGLMRRVGERAVAYYAAREGPAARAEEIYHRLRLGENPRDVDERWEPGVERHLGSAVQDMAPRAAAFLSGHLGGHIPGGVLRDADQEDWERITAQEVDDLLTQGLTEQAAARLAERRPWTPGSPLYPLLVATLERSGQLKEARAVAEDAADLAEQARAADAQLELLLLSGRLAEEDGDPQEAEHDFAEAEAIATALGMDLEAMDAMLHRARVAPSPERTAEIDDRLALQLRELPDEALAEQPVLARTVAARVSAQDPAALNHTLQVVGLPEADDNVLDALAEAINKAVARHPDLGPALREILRDATDPVGAEHVSTAGDLREARERGYLDELARRLLVLRDPSGELVSGVAAAMGSGTPGEDPGDGGDPGPAAPVTVDPDPHDTPATTAERNGPRAA
ncbi:AAA family ATPase [Streptomyces sp. NPDC127106]|uniref:AAA family ATPase n=1 Tax=Streptomyces sp. NPDC127106 TaxID=3345360 RepID=UPI00363652F2